jgi:hypothetical protein
LQRPDGGGPPFLRDHSSRHAIRILACTVRSGC